MVSVTNGVGVCTTVLAYQDTYQIKGIMKMLKFFSKSNYFLKIVIVK